MYNKFKHFENIQWKVVKDVIEKTVQQIKYKVKKVV